jgi:RNA polymerase sigma-70 factor, ECF subfamily
MSRPSECFIERLSPALRAQAQALDLDRLLGDVLARSVRRWPTVTVGRDAYLQHLAAKMPPGDLARGLDTLHVEDLYLAAGCALGDAPSLRAFEETFFSSRHADELKATLRERLLVRRADAPPRIADYSGKAPLESWFNVAAARANINLNRGPVAAPDDGMLDALPLEGEGLELAHMKRLYRSEFTAAFRDALKELTVRDRNVLRLRYVEALTLEQVAAIEQVHPITVARWQASAIKAVLDAVRGALMTRLSIDPGELDSILRLVRSDLNATLSGLLKSS